MIFRLPLIAIVAKDDAYLNLGTDVTQVDLVKIVKCSGCLLWDNAGQWGLIFPDVVRNILNTWIDIKTVAKKNPPAKMVIRWDQAEGVDRRVLRNLGILT
jgi:hypothetical protein